ncbi:putative quinol monooxygenase, partial [Amycolatopsis thermalba]
MTEMCELFELRQYTLHPGRREELVALFDRHFVESQAEAGMRVYGQFRDLDDPDRFVWIRGFPDAARRAEALAAFYERHPAWRTHRHTANATMVDSGDVLLLEPVTGSLDAAGAGPPGVAGFGAGGAGPPRVVGSGGG